jgi:predicted AAA+ superfamily ATPase
MTKLERPVDIRFRPHNTHLEHPTSFPEHDPHLKQLRRQKLIHRSSLLDRLPGEEAGIYTLGGGRQVGKTTLLKQWMWDLLKGGVAPRRIVFLTGELIDDHHSLIRILGEVLQEIPAGRIAYILLDEVTYIREWDRGIKYLADAGMLENVVFFLTGSDLAFIREAHARFPGRRGKAAQADFHLYPLTFFEAVKLKGGFSAAETARLLNPDHELQPALTDRLFREFEAYLVHGGFLTAMNEMAADGRISTATLATYSDWIRGDVLKRGKQEHYLREILSAIVKRYGAQVTWNNLARDLSIDHPKTVADYVSLLESMDAVFVQSALIEDKLAPAPKKARKVMFSDPFIFHAVRHWLRPGDDPYENQIRPLLEDSEGISSLAESCAVTQYRRFFPTFYIKAKGEVDIAYVAGGRFHPVEVKWTRQIRAKDIEQISRYRDGRILDRSNRSHEIGGIPAVPLPLALFQLGAGKD